MSEQKFKWQDSILAIISAAKNAEESLIYKLLSNIGLTSGFELPAQLANELNLWQNVDVSFPAPDNNCSDCFSCCVAVAIPMLHEVDFARRKFDFVP